jgi:polyhydroxybutyrate depolymerase
MITRGARWVALLLTVLLCAPAVIFSLPAAASATAAHHLRPRQPRVELTLVPTGWTTTPATLGSGGIERHYLVIRPPKSTGPLPTVVVLPGRSLDPTGIERMSELIPIVGHAIFVYPAGVDRSWNAGACCGLAHSLGINDVAFLDALIRHIVATEPGASARQVYLIGFSNGGRMAYRMACQSPRLVAGFAAVEAVPVSACRKLDPAPAVIIAQSRDPLLTVAASGRPKTVGRYVEPTVDATVAHWLALEGCGSNASVATMGSARVATYDGCRGAGRLEYVLYAGGRHDWPLGDARTPSAGQLIWAFLRHTSPHGELPLLAHHPGPPGPRRGPGAVVG